MRTLKTRPILTRKPSDRYVADAIAILGKYGGSLWVPDSRYSRVSSDGSGPQTDTGSDVGYVRDLCALYGPERVTDVELSTGNSPVEWTTSNTNATNTVVFSPGFVTFTTSDTTNISINKANALTVGSVYEAEIAVTNQSGGIVPGIFTGNADISFGSGAGTKRVIFIANNATLEIKRIGGGVGSFTIDRVSVKEVIGRPLFQATTGFKPKLRRVPRKLGPELVTNGDFSQGSVGWSGITPGASISGGVLNIISTSGEYQGAAQLGIVQIGKTYVVQADVVINSGTGGVAVATGGAQVGQFTTGKLYGTLIATGTSNVEVKRSAASGVNATVDNVSVREVLEWGWAWVFDGIDDLLATVAQPSVAAETLIVAKQVNATPSVGGAAITRGPSPANTGSLLYANASSATAMRIGTGSALTYLSANNPILTPVVQSGVFAAQSKHRVNGVQSAINNTGFASNTMPINVGGYSGLYVSQHIYAAAYAPTAIPDAELLIIERAMGQLAGVTI